MIWKRVKEFPTGKTGLYNSPDGPPVEGSDQHVDPTAPTKQLVSAPTKPMNTSLYVVPCHLWDQDFRQMASDHAHDSAICEFPDKSRISQTSTNPILLEGLQPRGYLISLVCIRSSCPSVADYLVVR